MRSLPGVAIILAVVVVQLLHAASNATAFSRPPSNLPVKKVVIHGRTIYVRPTYSQPIATDTYRVPQSLPSQAIPLRDQYLTPRVSDQYVRPLQYVQPPQPRYVQPLPTYRPASLESYVPEPLKPNYPLPECYTNDSGFMCCNKELEHLIGKTFDDLKKSHNGKWQNCNVQQLASKLNENAEKAFNTSFESIAGIGDYASKSHFFSNFICKVEREGRYMLAYGSPKHAEPESEPYGPPPQTEAPPPYRTWRF
ncbi:hypothetical protein L596_002535 [Steinernema carpocapsae]|uniref:Ground-like domain-containing protein n=1 Tax=Steinernema carpocapsae TaxID=34508 RepID=A0A4U8URD2_STECR|nr:hypothetical protein L596_002535 [Steinernema carpocapsae]